MLKYKLISHRKENERLILKIRISELFGIHNKEVECIETNMIYIIGGKSIWQLYPSMRNINPKASLLKACIRIKKEIESNEIAK